MGNNATFDTWMNFRNLPLDKKTKYSSFSNLSVYLSDFVTPNNLYSIFTNPFLLDIEIVF